MTTFERRPHQVDVSDAFESIVRAADLVGAAFGHIDEMRHEFASEFGGVDEVRHAEALTPCLLLRIHIDADNHCGADEAKALDDVQTDAAEPEHNAFGARFDLCGIDHRADAGGNAAANVTDLIERRVLADFRHGDFGQNGEIREG